MTTSPAQSSSSLLPPRKLLAQLLGFALGVGLLIWCIRTAVHNGGEGWQRLRDADPLLLAGLVACTLASLTANGAIFWLVIKPIASLRFHHMQLLNLVAAILNYAPVRAGLIARIAYHLRVDQLPVLVLGGWLAAIGYTMLISLTAVLLATILRQHYAWSWLMWASVLGGLLGLLGLLTMAGIALGQQVVGREMVQRVGKGMHEMLSRPATLWGAIGLRLIDIAGFVGRMACAAAILKLPLSGSQIVLLAVIAMAVSLFPLGRVGYREAGVAFFAQYLGMSGEDFEAARSQLALIESAGEAIVAIPLGALALLWYRKRWIAAAQRRLPSPIESTE